MTIQLNAATRLQSTQVRAATDTAGAVKYLKQVFQSHDLGVKSIKATDDSDIWVEFKAPAGQVNLGVFLEKRNTVYFELLDDEGICPAFDSSYGPDLSSFFTLNSKQGAKDIQKSVKAMEKRYNEAYNYIELLGKCHEWALRFADALTEIQKNMDKPSRRK